EISRSPARSSAVTFCNPGVTSSSAMDMAAPPARSSRERLYHAERSEVSVASSRRFPSASLRACFRLRLQNDSDGTLALEERSRQRVVWLLFARLVVHAALAGKARLNAHDV